MIDAGRKQECTVTVEKVAVTGGFHVRCLLEGFGDRLASDLRIVVSALLFLTSSWPSNNLILRRSGCLIPTHHENQKGVVVLFDHQPSARSFPAAQNALQRACVTGWIEAERAMRTSIVAGSAEKAG
jgi:hypothetical protein